MLSDVDLQPLRLLHGLASPKLSGCRHDDGPAESAHPVIPNSLMAREKLQELLGMLQAGDPATMEAARAGMLMVRSTTQISCSFIVYELRPAYMHVVIYPGFERSPRFVMCKVAMSIWRSAWCVCNAASVLNSDR